jgi:hypothetical protein
LASILVLEGGLQCAETELLAFDAMAQALPFLGAKISKGFGRKFRQAPRISFKLL